MQGLVFGDMSRVEVLGLCLGCTLNSKPSSRRNVLRLSLARRETLAAIRLSGTYSRCAGASNHPNPEPKPLNPPSSTLDSKPWTRGMNEQCLSDNLVGGVLERVCEHGDGHLLRGVAFGVRRFAVCDLVLVFQGQVRGRLCMGFQFGV